MYVCITFTVSNLTCLLALLASWYVRCSCTGVVRFTVTFPVVGGESWRLFEALRSFIVSTHSGHGCVAWTLSLSSESGCSPCLRYVEDWASEQELRDRVRSERFPRLLAVMEAALTRPCIVFELVTGSRGLEYVEEVRQAQAHEHDRDV